MALKCGINSFDGVPVVVERKRIRRINVRVDAEGTIRLSVPRWWATIAEGEAFLRANWKWCIATRTKVLALPVGRRSPPTEEELAGLRAMLADLHAFWTAKLEEPAVTWKLRRMKSLWGSCHWRKRCITYNSDLARVPRELTEYVVVHELTHLQIHDHGPRFRALMDVRLPDWQDRRHRLNRRQFRTDAQSENSDIPPCENI